MRNHFSAGAASVDITPSLGTIINGDFTSHDAGYIHDPLFAKALVMQSAGVTIVIVVVDICVMDNQFIKEVKESITEQTSIKTESILISATHTHAAGSVTGLLLGAADATYRRRLPALIVKAVLLARENCQPAAIAFGNANAPEHVCCRRYFMKEAFFSFNPLTKESEIVKTNPAGAEDKIIKPVASPDAQLSFFCVRGKDGNWISIVANYSLHYVGDWENGTISADYFGYYANRLKQRLGADDSFIAMMSNGTSGDVNIWDFMHPERYPSALFAKSEMIGNDLADKTFSALENLSWDSDPIMAIAYHELPVNTNKPSTVDIALAKERVDQADFDNIIMNKEGLEQLYAREQILLNEYPDTAELPLQVFRIGYGAIGALSGEFFSETGLWLKEQASSPHYFTVTLANGFHGYVPPAHEIDLGGYETWRCRTSYLQKGAEALIRQKLLELIRQVTS